MNIDIIKNFEGFSAKPYPDPATKAAPYTIGYGTTFYENGVKVTMKDSAISMQRAEELLINYINKMIMPVLNSSVKSILTENQKSALISFIYNLGGANFKSSTLLKLINKNPKDPAIRAEFLKWNKAAGKVMAGLTRRRIAEADLYFKN